MRPSTRSLTAVFDDAIALMRQTVETNIADQAERAIEAICKALREGLPLLVCGNGGSASDAMHITGELVGRFLVERKALNCICLSSNPAVLTAWSNDYSFQTVFSRVRASGRRSAVAQYVG
jgi:D-sedoheptulose 7-phosphate isomerase